MDPIGSRPILAVRMDFSVMTRRMYLPLRLVNHEWAREIRERQRWAENCVNVGNGGGGGDGD